MLRTFELPAAIVLVLGGAVACFAGYRLFRVVLAIYGFILGAMLASSVMGISNHAAMIIAALVGGIIGALLFTFAYYVCIGLIGAGHGHVPAARRLGLHEGTEPTTAARDHRVGGGRDRRDDAAALRDHRLDGVFRRVDDDRRRAGARR